MQARRRAAREAACGRSVVFASAAFSRASGFDLQQFNQMVAEA
jgi:hypothetical protein